MVEGTNKIIITDEDGNEIEFYVLEETKINGQNYILTTDAEENEDGECYILKDISEPQDTEAIYEFVEDDAEADYVFNIFTELMEDSDTEFIK